MRSVNKGTAHLRVSDRRGSALVAALRVRDGAHDVVGERHVVGAARARGRRVGLGRRHVLVAHGGRVPRPHRRQRRAALPRVAGRVVDLDHVQECGAVVAACG